MVEKYNYFSDLYLRSCRRLTIQNIHMTIWKSVYGFVEILKNSLLEWWI